MLGLNFDQTDYTMDNINPSILKTTLESIPLLTDENYGIWRTKFMALSRIAKLTDNISGVTPLDEGDNDILVSVLLSKLSVSVHSNVINHTNETNSQLIWKAITDHFASEQPSTLLISSFSEKTTFSYSLLKSKPAELE